MGDKSFYFLCSSAPFSSENNPGMLKDRKQTISIYIHLFKKNGIFEYHAKMIFVPSQLEMWDQKIKMKRTESWQSSLME